MISFVKGKLDTVNANSSSIIIDCSGIGYEISIGLNTISKLPPIGEPLKIYTYMQVRDDGVGLYGFTSKDELNMFHMLISVSGVGPKGAVNMLSVASPQDLMLAIIAGDVKVMSKFPGIGPKTAGRLILELKDKIKTDELIAVQDDFSGSRNNEVAEAIEALISLGYSRQDTVRAVYSLDTEGLSVEDVIKMALKKLAKF